MSPNQIEASQTKQEEIRTVARLKTRDLSRQIDFPIGRAVRVLLKKKLFGKEKAKWSDTIHKVSGGSTFNTSFQVDGKAKRWKHYELKKVNEKVEQNPFERKPATKGFDVEKHMEAIRRPGRGTVPPPRKPELKPKKVKTATVDPKREKALKDAQKYVGKEFADGGKQWVIDEVKWLYKGVYALYHEKGKPKVTERTALKEILEHARFGKGRRGSEQSKLNQARAIQVGSFVYIKNHGVSFQRRFVKLVTPDAPFFWVGKVTRIKGKEMTIQWYRENKKNTHVKQKDKWDEEVRSGTLIDPPPRVGRGGVVSLSGELWERLHVV